MSYKEAQARLRDADLEARFRSSADLEFSDYGRGPNSRRRAAAIMLGILALYVVLGVSGCVFR